MYTIEQLQLEQLQSKTFGELKKIGYEINVLPPGDRRRRESWINAIAGVNPPLLQLLEVSPGPKVEQVQPIAEAEPVQDAPLESKFGRIVYPRPAGAITTPKFQVGDLVQSRTMTWGLKKESMTGTVLELLPRGGVRVQFGNVHSGYGGTFDFSKSQLEDLIPVQDAIEPIDALVNTSQRQDAIEPIDALVNTSQRQDAIEPVAKTHTGVDVDPVQGAISQVAKTHTSVDVDPVQDIINQTWTSWEKQYCAWLKNAKWCIYRGENKRIDAFLPVSKTLRLEGMKKGTEYCTICEVSECTYDFNGLPLPVSSSLYPQNVIEPVAETSPGAEADPVKKPFMETVEASPGREWVDTEPPDPNDYEFREEYDERYKEWAAAAIPVKASPVAETEPLQEPIVLASEDTPDGEFISVFRATFSSMIEQSVKTSSAVDDVHAPEPIVLEDKTPPGVERSVDYLDCPNCGAVRGLYATDEYFRWETRCIHCTFVERSVHHPFEYTRPFELPLNQLNYLPVNELSPKTSTAKEQLDGKPKCEPKLSLLAAQCAIAPATKNLPGSRSKTSTAHQLLELFKSSAHIIEDSPGVKTEATVSESAIEQAGKNQESDLNPILTGLSLSDRLLTRYSPPQAEVFQFQADADGQLSLLDFEVQSPPEPPDPDDFESLDAFQEALARWDAENAEMIAVSIDSMSEWAPCPDEWYEPEPEILPLKASSMMELSPPAIECSITSANFIIPTFDAWCDRANRQTDTDEPPDTGIFARLPRPNPPKFPPQASQPKSAQVRRASRSYPETIPKLFCVAAGHSTQPARSPPGGDA